MASGPSPTELAELRKLEPSCGIRSITGRTGRVQKKSQHFKKTINKIFNRTVPYSELQYS